MCYRAIKKSHLVLILSKRKYWVGQKVHSEISVTSNGKTRRNVLASPIYWIQYWGENSDYARECAREFFFFYHHDYLCIFYKHSNQKVNTIANTEMHSISTKAWTGMIQTNFRIILCLGKEKWIQLKGNG